MSIFTLVNAVLWGDGGFDVHLLGIPTDAYMLVWFWIAMIGIMFVPRGTSVQVPIIISMWWSANIATTTILNSINYRGIEQGGDLFFVFPGLVLDFVAQGAVDFASLYAVWYAIKRKYIDVSAWMLLFCAYLVANLFGHSFGSYYLMTGVNPDTVGQAYDSYMYLTFTVMLIIQASGSVTNSLVKWMGHDLDLYRDIRPYLRSYISRHLHLR